MSNSLPKTFMSFCVGLNPVCHRIISCNALHTSVILIYSTELQSDETLGERLAQFNTELSLSSDERFGLQHFTYNNSGVLDLVFDAIEKTNFTGITVSM